MRRQVWARLLCFALITDLLIYLGWAATIVPWRDAWIVPSVTCPMGLLLLFVYRNRDEANISFEYWQLPYALLLCIFDPLMMVSGWAAAAPYLTLLLAPLVWVGVVRLRRGVLMQAIGAWLVVCGQFFALVFNKGVHGATIGCWKFCYLLT